METINLWHTIYTRETLEEQLEHARNLKTQLHNKEITPRQIIGTGYVNSRLSAEIYLAEEVVRYETLLAVMDESKRLEEKKVKISAELKKLYFDASPMKERAN